MPGGGAAPLCPKCRSQDVRRSRRRGAVDRVLGLAAIYPFRCQRCDRRFKVMQWAPRGVWLTAMLLVSLLVGGWFLSRFANVLADEVAYLGHNFAKMRLKWP